MIDHDPEGTRLPIKVDTASNGEYCPLPLSKQETLANQLALQKCTEHAKQLNVSRRGFLKSACGAATTLLVMNHVNAAAGLVGGWFDLPKESAFEVAAAEELLSSNEFIMDMQTHCVDPSGNWALGEDGELWTKVLTEVFGQASKCSEESFECYSAQQMIKEVFLDSDTNVGVVSALWGARNNNPTPTEYAAEARALIETIGDRNQILIHGGVLPNEPGALDYMDVQAKEFKVDAWKLYPQWGPNRSGYFMDDPEYGIPMLEKALALDVKVVCSHRGVPLPNLEYKYSHPADIARAAKLFPDLTFLCYHSGFEPGHKEGAYDKPADEGIDRLLTAYIEQGFKPNEGNLYAEMGSLWRHYMSKPEQAAHVIGKLLKVFGDERICWGTDSIWYGSPQDQIQAFRSFQISEKFQDKYGYTALTKESKQKIFGLNAARIHNIEVSSALERSNNSKIGLLRKQYRQDPNPSYQTFGPKSQQTFQAMLDVNDGFPA